MSAKFTNCKWCDCVLSGCVYERTGCNCEQDVFVVCIDCHGIGCERCGCPHPGGIFDPKTTCPACNLENAYWICREVHPIG